MLRYALLAWLCLLAGANDEISYDFRKHFHVLAGRQLQYYIISPDTFKARETFLVAEYEQLEHQSPLKVQVKLTLINDRRDTTSKQCSLILKAKPQTSKWQITSLRRISENNLVLTWNNHGKNEVYPTSQVLVYDMHDCQVKDYIFDSVMKNPIVVPTTPNQFIVFINDLKHCRHQASKCWWTYDMAKSTRHESRKFDNNMDWSTLRVERLTNGNLTIHGSSLEKDRYIVLLLNPQTNQIKFVTKIPYNNRKFDVVSSGMSFCWFVDQKLAYTAKCKQLDDQGKEIFSKKITFDQPRILMDVRPVGEAEILMVTKPQQCKHRECWNMWATRVTAATTEVEQTPLAFKCTADDQTRLTVFQAKNDEEYPKTDFHYGCKRDNGFELNTFFIWRLD